MDKIIHGKVYGERIQVGRGLKGRAKGMLGEWGAMSIGAFSLAC